MENTARVVARAESSVYYSLTTLKDWWGGHPQPLKEMMYQLCVEGREERLIRMLALNNIEMVHETGAMNVGISFGEVKTWVRAHFMFPDLPV